MSGRELDVLTVTDFRYSGGTTASIAQEVEIQARMGLRTGLIHIAAPHMKRGVWAERIRALIVGGYAQLVEPTEPVTARLMVLRHPRVFEHASWSIAARAERVVMVANQVHQDGTSSKPYYDLEVVKRRLRDELGADPIWAPIGPMMRDSLEAAGESAPAMTDENWCNVIDVDSWAPAARGERSGPLRVGRHSRDNFKKWPERRADILAAYPDSPDVDVRVLGGAKAAWRVLNRRTRHWRVFPFGSLSPRQFLHSLDAYVYHHHSGWQEAFGRAVLEALAAGLPVITHPYFERLFGDTCTYCEPADVPARLAELGDRPPINTAGIELVRQRYDWAVHARRVTSLIGGDDLDVRTRPEARTRILFITSNGGGLGHLTRVLAIARRLPDEFEPVFLTMSAGVAAVRELGYWVDHIPGAKSGLLRNNDWLDYVEDRVNAAVRHLAPAALVFDGTFPYRGLRDALDSNPQIFKVWSRRGMWKPVSMKRTMQAKSHIQCFDAVITPGEYAAEVDDGFTTANTERSTAVPPVVLLDPDELLDRDAARAELGIGNDKIAVLLNLAAGDADRVRRVVTAVADILHENPAVHLVTAQSIIAATEVQWPEGRVSVIETYPLARIIRAFDFCVAAPGYNAYHEMLAYAVPTLFIPRHVDLDDQDKRATWGHDAGVNFVSSATDAEGLRDALQRLLDPEVRAAMTRRCRQLVAADGGASAASLIAAGASTPHLERQPRDQAGASEPLLGRWIRGVRKIFRRSGKQRSSAPERTLFVLGRGALDTDAGRRAVEAIRALGDAAICLVGPDEFSAVRRLGLAVELITRDLDGDDLANVELGAYAIAKAGALVEGYNCRSIRYVGQSGLHKQLAALRYHLEPTAFDSQM